MNRRMILNTVGLMLKVEAAKKRILDICPDCVVRTHAVFYTPETADQFDFSDYDYIVDAIDTVSGKIELDILPKYYFLNISEDLLNTKFLFNIFVASGPK